MKRYVFVLCIIVFTLTCACQPTPEQDIVVNKQESTVKEGETGAQYDAPQTFVNTFSCMAGGVDTVITVDSAVEIAPQDRYPVYRVSPQSCPAETVQAFVRACVGDRTLYVNVGQDGMTRSMAQRQREEYDALLDENHPAWIREREDPHTEEEDLVYTRSELERRITACQEQYQKLSDVLTGDVCDRIQLPDNAALYADAGGVLPAVVTLRRNGAADDLFTYHAGSRRGAPAFAANRPNLANEDDGSLHVSQEDARRTTDRFMASCSITDMSLSASGKVFWLDKDAPLYHMAYRPVYVLVYTPMADGIPMPYVDAYYLTEETHWRNSNGTDAVNKAWNRNALFVFADDTGVPFVSWQNAAQYEIAAVVTEHAALLPFEEIMWAFSTNISYGTGFSGTNVEEPFRPERQTLYIDRITLGYACLLSGDGADSYRLVPAWDFFGHMAEEYDGGTEYASTRMERE